MSRAYTIAVHWMILVALGALTLAVLPPPPPASGKKGQGQDILTSVGLAPEKDAGTEAGKTVGSPGAPKSAKHVPTETEKLLWALGSLILAATLASLIAYHPIHRAKMGATAEDTDAPPMRILVAVAAAIIVMVVLYVGSALAFAIFGLSGFVRVFRTRLKRANEISMILLCSCIGMIAGIQQFGLAVTTTAFIWILFWIVGAKAGGGSERLVLTIRGLDEEARTLAPVFRDVLEKQGVQILSSKLNMRKGRVTFAIRKPGGITTDELTEVLSKVEGSKPKSITWEGGEEEDI
ncbi:MAG: hypothetical protein JXP34_17875 [Planctomycetes bacterium]|nr:hypothetical protein [Planctomycetota bacterium]